MSGRGERTEVLRGGLALLALVVLLPFLIEEDPYYLSVMTSVAMFAAPAMGAWLLIQTGLFSFGLAAFGSIGCYTTAILINRTGIGIGWDALLAVAFSGLVAAVFAIPFLRARRTAFAVLTMVSLLAVEQIVVLTPSLTGGGSGLITEPLPIFQLAGSTIDLSSPLGSYYLIAAVMLLCIAIARLIASGPRLLALRAIAQDEQLAGSLGIRVNAMRAVAFFWAACFSAAAGAFSAPYLQVAQPRTWSLFPSIFIVAYAIVGGRRSIFGPLIGSAVAIAGLAVVGGDRYQSIVLGVGLIVVVLFLPDGLAGGIRALFRLGRERLRGSRPSRLGEGSGDAA
jgi:branched-chain amino acid transport system permease protein